MIAPLPPFAFALLTWRESIVGLAPTESVQMDIRRTWDVMPVTSTGSNLGNTLGGGVESETLGFVRWRLRDESLFNRPLRLLRSEAYDKRAATKVVEEVWADADGAIVRQREERTDRNGRRTGDAIFFPDRIDLTRVDERGGSSFAEMHPGDGMEAVQARFRPLSGEAKSFVRLDAVRGSFVRVDVRRVGHFRGSWGGDGYDGPAYRFTIDGKEQTVMMTVQNEIVQVAFGPQVALVLAGPTKSRRKPGYDPSILILPSDAQPFRLARA